MLGKATGWEGARGLLAPGEDHGSVSPSPILLYGGLMFSQFYFTCNFNFSFPVRLCHYVSVMRNYEATMSLYKLSHSCLKSGPSAGCEQDLDWERTVYRRPMYLTRFIPQTFYGKKKFFFSWLEKAWKKQRSTKEENKSHRKSQHTERNTPSF